MCFDTVPELGRSSVRPIWFIDRGKGRKPWDTEEKIGSENEENNKQYPELFPKDFHKK